MNTPKRAYNGRRAGCMCGCNGDWYDEGSKGYDNVAKKVKKFLDTTGEVKEVEVTVDYTYVELNTGRVYSLHI